MRKVLAGLAAIAVSVVASACSTEPATNVAKTSATLNGTGLSGQSAVKQTFQYATDPADLGTPRGLQTPVVATTPAGSQQPSSFSYAVTGLKPNTDYVYRTCGTATGEQVAHCDNTVAFTTGSLLCRSADGFRCVSSLGQYRSGTTLGLIGDEFTTDVPITHWSEVDRGAGTPVFSSPRVGPELNVHASFDDVVTGLAPRGHYRHRTCAQAAGDARPTCSSYRDDIDMPSRFCGAPDDACGVTSVGRDSSTGQVRLVAQNFTLIEPVVHFFRLTNTATGAMRTTPEVGPEVLTVGERIQGFFAANVSGLIPGATYKAEACAHAPGDDEVSCGGSTETFTVDSGL